MPVFQCDVCGAEFGTPLKMRSHSCPEKEALREQGLVLKLTASAGLSLHTTVPRKEGDVVCTGHRLLQWEHPVSSDLVRHFERINIAVLGSFLHSFIAAAHQTQQQILQLHRDRPPPDMYQAISGACAAACAQDRQTELSQDTMLRACLVCLGNMTGNAIYNVHCRVQVGHKPACTQRLSDAGYSTAVTRTPSA